MSSNQTDDKRRRSRKKSDMILRAESTLESSSSTSTNLDSPHSSKRKQRVEKSEIIEFFNIQDHSNYVQSKVSVDLPLFQPTPSRIVIDKYEPFGATQVKLSLRNKDVVSRRVKIEAPDSPYFSISAPRAVSKNQTLRDGRVAAGMEICYIITFSPQERREYTLSLVVCTERERFVVPIIATGTFAALSLPEQMDFSTCPVKIETTKVISVHNTGTKASKFVFTASEGFSVTPRSAFVDMKRAVQLQVAYFPTAVVQNALGSITVQDQDGKKSFMKLVGASKNLNVYLESPIVEPDSAYISLTSHAKVKIYNKSDTPVKFCWKAFGTYDAELQERQVLYDNLDKMEQSELHSLDLEEGDESDSSDDDEISQISVLKRKYRNLRRAVKDDQMEFADDCFVIEPSMGEIWANSEIEVTFGFSPETAASYSCTAFLDVTGREDRLPLRIQGQGIGPKASLSFDVLDIANLIYVNSVHKYDLELQNQGDIPAQYNLKTPVNTVFGSKFQFSPSAGTLEVGQTQLCHVTFCSDVLGEFSEHFEFILKGSTSPLCVQFKGHVIGPTFKFDVDALDFGVVSYGFTSTEFATLMNMSEIQMKYRLRVPQDGRYSDEEFVIEPSEGVIPPKQSHEIKLLLKSLSAKVYDYCLAVDVDGVGEDLLSIPISAECRVASVSLESSELSFGNCFLRFPYTSPIVLVNESPDLKAMYEILEQDEHTRVVATYDAAEESIGEIEAGESKAVDLSVVCERLGKLRVPLAIRILGSTDPPLGVTVLLTGKGPSIKLASKTVDFGECSCLVDHTQTFEITNTSDISATIKTFIKSARSKFSVNHKEIIVEPHASIELTLTANLDDTIAFREELHLLVTEGDNIMVPLLAKGKGTTMWSEQDLNVISFGHRFTNRDCEWKCTIENKGKRSQQLTWVNSTVKSMELEAQEAFKKQVEAQKRKHRKAGGAPPPTASSSIELQEVKPVFTVHPEQIELKPRTACTFTFYGSSVSAGEVSELLLCECKLAQEKKTKQAFSTNVKAMFINPMLTPSVPSLSYSYVYSPEAEACTQSKPLTLSNSSKLPLTFVLRTTVPFSLDTWECSLAPGEDITLNVEFDPGYKDDHQSALIHKKLTAVFKDHPQKDSFDLFGEISYPNLTFETNSLDFGCIFNDTTKTMLLDVRNDSKVDTTFHWAFVEEEQGSAAVLPRKKPHIPINKVFDILPIRSHLKSGESEKIEVVFYGHSHRKFVGNVVCEVEGGPEYDLQLQGEASGISYKIDKRFVDFGQVLYDQSQDRDFYITNTGKVPFSFNVNTNQLKRSKMLSISPMSGKIAANDKQKVHLKFVPGIPDDIVETLILEVGHFPPLEFKVYGSGIYSSVGSTLPKENHHACVVDGSPPSWASLMRQAKKNLLNPRPEVVPPEEQVAESFASGAASKTSSRSSGAKNNAGGTMTSRQTQRTVQSTSRLTSRQTSRHTSRVGGSLNRAAAAVVAADPLSGLVSKPTPAPGPVVIRKTVSPMEIETEARRILFMNYLLSMEKAEEIVEDDDSTNLPDANQMSSIIVPPLSLQASEKSIKIGNVAKSVSEDIAFCVSQYVLDFGNIVAATCKQKKFRLTNTGHVPISFMVDKNLALQSGFTIKPERVVRLPEGESVDFKVVFQARKHVRHGKVRVNLPIEIKNGPLVIVSMRANVTIPELTMSSELLNFGRVVVGRSNTIVTQLHNISPAVAEWGIKNPMGSIKDLGYFKIEPMGGHLQPGAKINVTVEFVPREARPYAIQLPLKITTNPKAKSLTLRGDGDELRLKFEPPLAELGPVLPFSEPASKQVLLVNPTAYDIELYSLDFDTRYGPEEQIIREATGYGVDDIIKLPIRSPGDPLPESILLEYEERQREAQKQMEENEAAVVSEEIPAEEEETDTTDDAEDPQSARTEIVEIIPTLREQEKATDYIIIGPYCSGVSTQASKIATRENLCLWTIDEAITSLKEDPSELGDRVRSALGAPPLLKPTETSTEEESDTTEENQEPEESSPEDVGTVDNPQAADVLGISDALLSEIIAWRVSQTDAENGSVLDSLYTSCIPVSRAAPIVTRSLPGATVVSLVFNDEAYERHLNAAQHEQECLLRDLEQQLTLKLQTKEEEGNNFEELKSLGEVAEEEEEAAVAEEAEKANEEGTTEEEKEEDGDAEPTETVVTEKETKEEETEEEEVVDDTLESDIETCKAVLEKVHEALKFDEFEKFKESYPNILQVLKDNLLHPPTNTTEDHLEDESSNESAEEDDDEEDHQEKDLPKPLETPVFRRGYVVEVGSDNGGSTSRDVENQILSLLEKAINDRLNDELSIPLPKMLQLVKKPFYRSSRKPAGCFSIVQPQDDKGPSKEEGNEEEEAEEAAETPDAENRVLRWIIPANSSCPIEVNFASIHNGMFDCALGFEIVGSTREYTLFCRGHASVPAINPDPRNVFMSRVKASRGIVKKKYVTSENTYEFGPLLTGKNPEIIHEPPETSPEAALAKRINAESFRISNTGSFTSHIDFFFSKEDSGKSPVFYVQPSSLDLNVGETQEVVVWAFPHEDQNYDSSLICCIKDNPNTVVFPVNCYGAKPLVEVTGPWNELESPSAPLLDFDRLLLQRQEEKSFVVKNTCKIPVKWRVAVDDLPSEFQISKSDGSLRPGEESSLSMSFDAREEKEFDFELNLEYVDAERGFDEDALDKIVKIPIRVKAEAYRIDVCIFENDEDSKGMLDFGLKRVGEVETKQFRLRNNGKYAITYELSVKRQFTRQLFTIEPHEGEIDTEDTAEINVSFLSSSEVHLKDNLDIKCVVMEKVTGEVHHEFNILSNARSVFSKFRLQPQRGLSFGALKFNEEPRVKRFELRNEGEFMFKYRVLPIDDPRCSTPLTLEEDTSGSNKSLSVGQFVLEPSTGTIDPGTLSAMEVTFTPSKSQAYRESVRIQISGMDANNEMQTSSLIYELSGESCFPGINTTDFESIFEEQSVVQRMDQGSSSSSATTSQNIYVEQDKKFSFGAIVCSSQKGIVQRFRISNPNKVGANVNFQIKSAADEGIFNVEPESWIIPPHEHRYVSVCFKPAGLKVYSATFAAVVEDGSDAETNRLEFDLSGQGTMPCMTIEKPVSRDESGSLSMDFGRVRAHRKKRLPLVLRNDGIVPSTILFQMDTNKSFSFSGRGGSITLQPAQSESLWVQFNPTSAQDESSTCLIKLNVLHNQFDESKIQIKGHAYQECVTFEDLPEEADDELDFGDVDLLGKCEKSLTFSLKNQATEAVRFCFGSHDAFSFSPSIGHIQGTATKLIVATFRPETASASQFFKDAIDVQIKKIVYSTEEDNTSSLVSDWDDSMTSIKYVDGEDNETQQVIETLAEPVHTTVEDSSANLSLLCSGAADSIKYKCDTKSISLKETFMFQTCAYEFSVENCGKIALPYEWLLVNLSAGRHKSARDQPFSITPAEGEILAEDSQTFVVRFSPKEVEYYRFQLECLLKLNHASDTESLVIPLQGQSRRPVCHVDLENSYYSQQRAPGLPGPSGELGPLDPAIRVVELKSLGTKVRNTKRFYIINPMNISYEFSWEQVGIPNASFRCGSSKGLMLAGKKCEMIFEFTPQNTLLQESFWRFKIPQFKIDQIFLLVGTTAEPNVVLDQGSFNFQTLLIGSKAVHTMNIINHEHIPFNFAFDRKSYDLSSVSGEKSALHIHPLSGVIPPNGTCPVEIEFAPIEEKDYNFNLVCNVKRKPEKLSLNVKGEGYAIHDLLTLTDDALTGASANTDSQQLMLKSSNYLDFGVVRVNEKIVKNIVISNTGKVNFEFNWNSAKTINPMLHISPLAGTVRKNDRAVCRIEFQPVQETSLDGLQLVCTTAGTRNYVLNVSGTAVPPAIHFSFSSHNFGPCFIADPGTLPISETSVLRITNQDPESDFNIDCLYEKTSFLRVQCQPTVLGPSEVMEVPIVFTARNEMLYNEVISVMINGSTTVHVQIQGEGIKSRLELSSLAQQHIDFGALQIGQTVTRVVKVINRAKRSTSFQLVDHVGENGATLESNYVQISPMHPMIVKPKEVVEIMLRFVPGARVRPFNEELGIRVEGSEKKLLIVSGSCHGMEVELEADTLPFGPVCLGSKLTRKLQLMNYGDLVAKFRWASDRFKPDFSISPIEGILPPGMDKKFEVTFCPTSVNADLQYEKIPLMIEGMDSLCVTLTGSCAVQPESSIKELSFESKVRQPQVKQLVLENPSTLPWNLIPVIQGEHWSSKETLAVPAKGKASLDVTYCPLTMTSSKENSDDTSTTTTTQRHQGSVFFALPDGTAILYNLSGVAGLPEACQSLTLTTSAKKALPITLKVKNWLQASQRFTVATDMAEQCESTFIDGAKTIDVPGATERGYTLKFLAYKEGKTNIRVTFCNESTGEYLFYDVSITVTAPGFVETISFDAPVRQVLKKIITIENPFAKDKVIEFSNSNWWKCSSADIRVTRLCELTGRPEGSFEVEYRPLLYVKEAIEAELVISCAALGDYKYQLKLSSTEAGTDRTLYFKTPLGGSDSQTYKFTSFLQNASTEYKCRVEQASFFDLSPSVVKAESTTNWDGTACNVVVKFEPEALGEIRDTLVLTSSNGGGEYKCALHGLATPPLPQGPFTFSSSYDISFRNVFNSSQEFLFSSDNSSFILSPKSVSIAAKTTKSVNVKLSTTGSSASAVTGKVLVTCPALPDMPPWVFYLEGNP